MASTDKLSTGPDRSAGGSPGDPLKGGAQGALLEISRLVTVLETERDLLVSGDWEGLDTVLEEKDRSSRRLSELLASVPSPADETPEEEPALRSALLHLSELASVNLVLARESSLMVEQVLRVISRETEGGGTYGASGTVDSSRPSPAMVSTRG